MQVTQTLSLHERIARMEALYHGFMQEYQSLVLPYGLGHGMPEETSLKATEAMDHAYKVLQQLRELMDKAGVSDFVFPPNTANAFLLQQHPNTPEFRESVAMLVGLTDKELTHFVAEEGTFFLYEKDSQRADGVIELTDFWSWVMVRLHPVYVAVVGMQLNKKVDTMILRKMLTDAVRARFASMETYSNYLLTFPKTK